MSSIVEIKLALLAMHLVRATSDKDLKIHEFSSHSIFYNNSPLLMRLKQIRKEKLLTDNKVNNKFDVIIYALKTIILTINNIYLYGETDKKVNQKIDLVKDIFNDIYYFVIKQSVSNQNSEYTILQKTINLIHPSIYTLLSDLPVTSKCCIFRTELRTDVIEKLKNWFEELSSRLANHYPETILSEEEKYRSINLFNSFDQICKASINRESKLFEKFSELNISNTPTIITPLTYEHNFTMDEKHVVQKFK